MSDKPSEKEDTLDLEPILEEPESVELPEAGVGTLFSEDLPSIASKLAALETFFKLLTADLPFQDFVRDVLLAVMKAVPSEAGSILEVNHEENTIFFRAAAGHASDKVIRFIIPMGQGIVGYVAESRQPLVVSNVGENSHHLNAIADSIGFDVRNLIALPIIIRGRVYGVLELLNRVGEKDYTENDVELLQQLADLSARAIEIRLMIGWAQRSSKKKTGEDAA